MAVELPDDVLHLICEAVVEDGEDDSRKAFGTLYSCAVVSRRFATPALTTLYKRRSLGPVKGEGASESLPLSEQLLVMQKWSILWRTIILSCLEKTLFPYCKYLKVLDFRDLNSMFDDEMFRMKVFSQFFEGDLERFKILQMPPGKAGRLRGPVLDRISTIEAIGEELTKHTAMADQVTGPVVADALMRWIPRLTRLRSLQLWDGEALGNSRLIDLITTHCPYFNDLSIYRWPGLDTDSKLSTFISGLPANRLQGFETIGGTGIASNSFLALNNQGQSLRKLILYFDQEAAPHLGLLKDCTALDTLEIEDGSIGINLQSTQHDVFLQMINWLRDCRALKNLSFNKFSSAAAILAQVLSNKDIQLEQLKLDSYLVKDQQAFHIALAKQHSLTSLHLQGNSDGIFADDKTIFIESLCQLKQLRLLKLVFPSDEVDLLSDYEIGKLAENLTNLEELYTSGYGVTDAVLPSLAALQQLRQLAINAVTSFSLLGLLDFVERLGRGNQDLALVIDAADPESALSEYEQTLVREALAAKVGGRLEYLLLRDPDAEDYSEDSD